MKHIELIEDEQVLEQISGGKAAAPQLLLAVGKRPLKGVLDKLFAEPRQICNQKVRVATFNSAWS